MKYVFGKSVYIGSRLLYVVMIFFRVLLSVETEVLFVLMISLARWLGVHADNFWTCRLYTFLLLGHLPMHGFPCQPKCATMLRYCMWLAMMLLSYLFPLFPPKKKTDAEKRDMAREELERFVLEHGETPSKHSELAESRSLYNKIQKLKLTHLLQHDWRKDVCQAVQTFYDNENRLPKRQNLLNDEKREEDLLAQRWDRLLTQKGSLSAGLLETYTDLFVAAEVEDEDGALATSMAVQDFYLTSHRLPKRQNGNTDAQKAEDALARRWAPLLASKESLSDDMLRRFSDIFEAGAVADEDGALATSMAVQDFYMTSYRLPKRQNGNTAAQQEEDALAQRWDRLVATKDSLSFEFLQRFSHLFEVVSVEDYDGVLATCVAVQDFYQTSNRLPKRQNGNTAAQKAEDVLARRWDRLVATKDSLSFELLQRFSQIFEVVFVEDDAGALATCLDVQAFFHKSSRASGGGSDPDAGISNSGGRLPKRQSGQSRAQKEEDALARRWAPLLASKESLSDDLLRNFADIFAAGALADEDGAMATCLDVQKFLNEHGVLPKRQKAGGQADKAAEDALAQRLGRLLSQHSSLSSTIFEQYPQVFEAAAGRWESAEKQGLANFLDDVSVLELFEMCGSLRESQVQRFIDSSLNEFKAACVAWLLARCEAGDEELTGVCMDGLDEWDDTSAVREELRQYVIASGQLPPVAGPHRSAQESRLHRALVQVRKRRIQVVKNTRKGRIIDFAAPLSEAQMLAWESVDELGPFLWNPRHVETFEEVQKCLAETGDLPVRGPRSPTDALAQKVRRIRLMTFAAGRKRMRQVEQQHWEKTFPNIWSQRQSKDYYLPASDVKNAEARRVFYRTPLDRGMLACELCDFDCDTALEFRQHLREEHFPNVHGGLDHDLVRCEEEYRKRMAFHEEDSGPFEVTGEQTRRGVAGYAFHQIHSCKGGEARERQLVCCVVCARMKWLEEMDRLRLFVDADKNAEDHMDDAASDDSEDLNKDDKKGGGWKIREVDKKRVLWHHQKIFDVYRYARLWPKIPLEELISSCVPHPTGTYENGTPWLWLVNKKALPPRVTSATASYACRECVHALTAKKPRMPKFALANSLWIGRYPKVFLHDGQPLSEMTMLLLSLGRPVAQKIIAEPHKARPVKEKQKGIRANTIAFPQAQLHEMATAHLPPLPEEAQRFLSQTISIALVGCSPEDCGIVESFW